MENVGPGETKVICLNPLEKDEDYLVIAFIDASEQVVCRVVYEIDSLSKEFDFK